MHRKTRQQNTVSMWRKISEGCNGVQAFMPHNFVDQNYQTLPDVIHAERNALARIPAGHKVVVHDKNNAIKYGNNQYVLISQTYPCPDCLDHIIHQKTLLNIVAVMYVDAYRETAQSDLQRLNQVGIALIRVPDEMLNTTVSDQLSAINMDMSLSQTSFRGLQQRIMGEIVRNDKYRLSNTDNRVDITVRHPIDTFHVKSKYMDKVFYSLITLAQSNWSPYRMTFVQSNITCLESECCTIFSLTDNVNNYHIQLSRVPCLGYYTLTLTIEYKSFKTSE